MSAPYYIKVLSGPRGEYPNKPHATLEIARAEAKRLHALLNDAYVVRILETVEDTEPAHLIGRKTGRPIIRLKIKSRLGSPVAA
jgi:hypothetical protein